MRVCGACGKPGHNARTCNRVADAQVEIGFSPGNVVGADGAKEDCGPKDVAAAYAREDNASMSSPGMKACPSCGRAYKERLPRHKSGPGVWCRNNDWADSSIARDERDAGMDSISESSQGQDF